MVTGSAGFVDAFLAADERFIGLKDLAAATQKRGHETANAHGLADSVSKEPCGL